jgi:hypothetical protein
MLLQQASLTNFYITETTQEKGGNVLHGTVVLFKSLHTRTPTLLYSLDHA